MRETFGWGALFLAACGRAIMGTDDPTQPVAIVRGSRAFCPPDDATHSFDVKIDGAGRGAYTFGIWTRPK